MKPICKHSMSAECRLATASPHESAKPAWRLNAFAIGRWQNGMKHVFVVALLILFLWPSLARAESERFLDIHEITTPAGLSVWMVEDHNIPVVALRFAFKGAGTVHDPEDKQGMVMLLSSTLDEGAGDMDAAAFQRALADRSISLSYSAGRDDFSGSLRMLAREREVAFDLLRLSLSAPRFDDDALERMRNANIARLRSSLSDPNWIASRVMNDIAFAGHPYTKNSGGTLSGLRAVGADDLRAHMRDYLTRDRLRIAVAGAITADEAAQLVDHAFAHLPETGADAAIPDGAVQGRGVVAWYENDAPQTVIQMMQPGLRRGDADWPAAQVMNFILGGSGFGSRLMEELREKRGLTYGVRTGFITMEKIPILSLSTSTANDSVAEVLDLIRAEWSRMAAEGLSAAEIDSAKAYLIGSMPLSLSSTDAIAGMVLGLRIDDLPATYLDTISARIDAVTPDDVRRVAAQGLDAEGLVTVLVGRPASVDPAWARVEGLKNVE